MKKLFCRIHLLLLSPYLGGSLSDIPRTRRHDLALCDSGRFVSESQRTDHVREIGGHGRVCSSGRQEAEADSLSLAPGARRGPAVVRSNRIRLRHGPWDWRADRGRQNQPHRPGRRQVASENNYLPWKSRVWSSCGSAGDLGADKSSFPTAPSTVFSRALFLVPK